MGRGFASTGKPHIRDGTKPLGSLQYFRGGRLQDYLRLSFMFVVLPPLETPLLVQVVMDLQGPLLLHLHLGSLVAQRHQIRAIWPLGEFVCVFIVLTAAQAVITHVVNDKVVRPHGIRGFVRLEVAPDVEHAFMPVRRGIDAPLGPVELGIAEEADGFRRRRDAGEVRERVGEPAVEVEGVEVLEAADELKFARVVVAIVWQSQQVLV